MINHRSWILIEVVVNSDCRGEREDEEVERVWPLDIWEKF
jgi:hypothetical protein